MERLSDNAIEIINEMHTERLNYESEYIPLIDAANKLSAYEDTGLEPEEIKDSIGWMSPVCVQCDGKTSDGIRTEKCGYPDNITKCLEQSKHLAELAQAEQDGRLVVLPCNVGDAAYWLHNGIITECRVHRVQMNRTGLFICLKSKVSHGAFRVDICLGKTVFLTREKAEAAMAGKGGDG